MVMILFDLLIGTLSLPYYLLMVIIPLVVSNTLGSWINANRSASGVLFSMEKILSSE